MTFILPQPGLITNEHNIPEALRALPQWLIWKPVKRGDKIAKLPLDWRNPFGDSVDDGDPQYWTTFDNVLAVMRSDTEGRFGIGIVLTEDAGLICFDADDPAHFSALDALTSDSPTYVEASISGRGRHYFSLGKLPQGLAHAYLAHHGTNKRIEVYGANQFIAITGICVPQGAHEIAPLSDDAVDYLARIPRPKPPVASSGIGVAGLTDARVYRVLNDHRPRSAEALTNPPAGDRSESLRNAIGDLFKISSEPAQVLRMVLDSTLGRATNGVERRFKYWAADAFANNTQGLPNVTNEDHGDGPSVEHGRKMAEAWPSPIPTTDDESIRLAAQFKNGAASSVLAPVASIDPFDTTPRFTITPPPGVIGQLAREQEEMMAYPNPTLAILHALCAAAGLTQRKYHVSGMGLNLYVMMLAETGSGKEAIVGGQGALLRQLTLAVSSTIDVVGPSKFASGQAIHKHMLTHPRCWSILNEASFLFDDLSAKNDTYGSGKKTALLDLRYKSALNGRLGGYIHSAKDDSVNKEAFSPALTLECEGQPDRFYAALDDLATEDGLLSRFLCIDCQRNFRGKVSKNIRREYSAELIQRLKPLAEIVRIAEPTERPPEMIEVTLSVAASELLSTYRATIMDRLSRYLDKKRYEIFNRSDAQALTIAATLAAADSPLSPAIEYEHLAWSFELVYRERSALLQKYVADEIGTGDRQRAAILTKYLHNGFRTSKSNRLTTKAKELGFVPKGWLADCVKGGNRAFAEQGSKGTTQLLGDAITLLVHDGILTPATGVKDDCGGLPGLVFQIDNDALVAAYQRLSE